MTRSRRRAIVGLYVLVFWLLLPAALAAVAAAIDRRAGWARPAFPPAVAGLGLLVLLGGLALVAGAMVELWRDGGGLPVSALPPPRLATRGPYASVRHPIYLGFNVALAGAGLLLGSPALALVVAPAFAPAWLAYAAAEERALGRRHGRAFRRYRARVGLLPRSGLYRLTQLLIRLGVFPTTAFGRERIPSRGAAILVANHASYLDPVYVGAATWRRVRFLATAEACRSGPLAWLVRRLQAVPSRRYRPDVVACREMVRLLAEGELVGLFPETERSPLGDYQGADPRVARLLARLPVPVIPVGLEGAYDSGPRWSDRLRRRRVRARVGEPLLWTGEAPEKVVDRALLGLVGENPAPVRLASLPLGKLHRVLWRCPRCQAEPAWDPAGLACGACSLRLAPTGDGWLLDERDGTSSLAGLGRAVLDTPEAGPLEVLVSAACERSWTGPLRPVEPMGEGTLRLDTAGLRFGPIAVAWAAVRSVTVERADTLQVATSDAMWQFRVDQGSAFRLRAAALRHVPESPSLPVRGPSQRLRLLLSPAAAR